MLTALLASITVNAKEAKVYLRTASNTSRTISNLKSGTLPNYISETDRDIIEVLTITGKLNGTDIKLIREMACQKLKVLDIGGCSIVEGGDKYRTQETYTPSVSAFSVTRYKGPPTSMKIIRLTTQNNIVGWYMFAGLSALETLILPNTVTVIGQGAFMDSPKLSSITFGSAVKTIGTGFLFYGSNNVNNLSFNGNSSFTANDGVIYNKAKSTIVAVSPSRTGIFNIESTVDSIAPHAFAGCMGITNVFFNGNPTYISDYAFCQSGLKSIIIPNSVKKIGDGAFAYCESLSSATITENIESIGYGAFAYCKLTTADLSSTKVIELGGDEPKYTYHVGVFEGTNTLNSVKLPSKIKRIGGGVFTSSLIQDLYCYSLPPSIMYNNKESNYTVSDTFSDIYSTCRLHVPENTVSYYKETNGWKEFMNIIDKDSEVSDSDDLQEYLDWLADHSGTEENPVIVPVASSGMTVGGNVDIDKEVHLLFDGGSGEPLSIDFVGGVISINNENSSLAFNNVVMTNGTMTRGQDIATTMASSGGIVNGGKLLLTGCTVVDGLITNSGSVYIDGATKVNGLANRVVGRIYITSPMTKTVSINISENDIETCIPIITGGNGYVLTAEDATHISITLPAVYEWKYDASKHAIVISKKGDSNDDNVIDVADIATIISYMAGDTKVLDLKSVDVNGDGVVDVADIATVISIMAGK